MLFYHCSLRARGSTISHAGSQLEVKEGDGGSDGKEKEEPWFAQCPRLLDMGRRFKCAGVNATKG